MTYEENNFYRTNSIFIISLSAVSAADNTTIKTNDHTDNIKTDDITINLEKTSQSENNDGYKTYEEFKKAIETSKEGDTIKLGSNIKLKDTLNIKTNITIDGQGHTIDGDEDYRIFYIPANYVTIQNLKLLNGDCDEGAAIYADKYLTVKKCEFTNNKASDRGGAIFNYNGNLDISDSMFKNNRASGTWGRDQYGGAIYSNGDLRVSNCNFTKNKAKTDGGAIYADAKVTATSSIFIINEAAGASSQCYAGAIYCTNIDCDKCIFDNNHAYDYGGAIYINNKGKSTIKNSKFTNNKADDYNGGAIYSKKNIEVYNSLFKNNQANNSWSPSTSQVGAIYCGTITCNNCTFENNKAKKYAGAIYINDKEVSTIKNSKFINNTSPFNGGAINIDDTSAHVVIKNNSFKGNTVDKDGEGSIIYNYGHFDKIRNNYYGTNNPDWKNALYEHKYFGLDVEHRDSNHVRL